MVQADNGITPALDILAETAKRGARRRAQFVTLCQIHGGSQQRLVRGTRLHVQGLDAGRAQPAFGRVYDAFKGQIICRLGNQPQIGKGITDLGTFIKARANHAVRQANCDEPFLKLAGLKPGAHQHGDL